MGLRYDIDKYMFCDLKLSLMLLQLGVSSEEELNLYLSWAKSVGADRVVVRQLASLDNYEYQKDTIHPLRVYAGMKIGQMLFWIPQGDIHLYEGKYKDSVGPEVSQICKGFKN